MPDPFEITQLLGDSVLDGAGKRLALRGAKATAMAVANTYDESAYKSIDLRGVFTGAEAYGARILAPQQYEDSPGIFLEIPLGSKKIWTPFVQVGTALGIEHDVLRLAMDFVLDPLFLFDFGTLGVGARLGAKAAEKGLKTVGRVLEGPLSGLTVRGQTGRLINFLTEGTRGGIVKGEQIVDAAAEAIEVAGKIRGAGITDELIDAAKAGDSKAISKLLKKAKGAAVDPQEARLVQALRQDKKGLVAIMSNMDEIVAREGEQLAPLFLQGTVREQVALRQVNDLLRLRRFANPLRHPTVFAQQALGFSYRDEDFWFPMGRSAGKAMDAVLGPAADLPAHLQAAPTLDAAEELIRRGRKLRHTDVTSWDYLRTVEPLVLINSNPRYRLPALFNEDPKKLKKEYDSLKRGSKNVPPFETWLKNTERQRMQNLRARDSYIKNTMSEAIESAEGRLGAWGEVLGVAEDEIKSSQEQLRRIVSVFDIDSIFRDGRGIAHGLGARANFGTLMAGNMAAIGSEIIVRNYGRGMEKEIKALLPRLIDRPELFEKRGDQIFLRVSVDEAREASPFLDELFRRDVKGNLTKILTEDGLSPEVTMLSGIQQAALEGMGVSAMANEGVLDFFIGNYFPRVFKPNLKFLRRMRLRRGEMYQAIDKIRQQGAEALIADVEGILKHLDDPGLMEAGEGWSRARRMTEELALELEKKGYGEYVRDGNAMFTHYVDSMNKAQMLNQLVRDMPEWSPRVTWNSLSAAEKKVFSGQAEFEMLNLQYIRRDVPARLQHLYTDIHLPGRTDPLGAERARMAAVLEQFRGQTTVAGRKLVSKKTKELMPFEPEWAIYGSWPRELVGWKQLKSKGFTDKRGNPIFKPKDLLVGKTKQPVLWVRKGWEGPLREAFRLYRRQGKDDTMFHAFMVLFDEWAFRLKSFVLMGDIFHYNTLAMNNLAANPGALLANLKDDFGRYLPGVREGAGLPPRLDFNAATGATAGAAVIGGTTAALGADEDSELLTGSLVGAVYGAMLGSARTNAMIGRRVAINPDNMDTLFWMGMGGWTGRPDDRAIGFVSRFLERTRKNLQDEAAKGTLKGAFLNPVTKLAHISEAWDNELWEVMHNGSKHFYFSTLWADELPKLTRTEQFGTKYLTKEYEERFTKQVSQEEDIRAGLGVDVAGEGGKPFRELLSEEHKAAADEFGKAYAAAEKEARKASEILKRGREAGREGLTAEERAARETLDAWNSITENATEWGQGLGAYKKKTAGMPGHETEKDVGTMWQTSLQMLGSSVDPEGFTTSRLGKKLYESTQDAVKPLADKKGMVKVYIAAPEGGFGESMYVQATLSPEVAARFIGRGERRKAEQRGLSEFLVPKEDIVTFVPGTAPNIAEVVVRGESMAGKPSKFFGPEGSRALTDYGKRELATPKGRIMRADALRRGSLYERGEDLAEHVGIPNNVSPRLRQYIQDRRFDMKRQLAAQIVQSSNNMFGGQSFANLFGDPEIQFFLRRMLLAPDWTSSRLAMTSMMFANMGPMQAALAGAGAGSVMELAGQGFDLEEMPWNGLIYGSALGLVGRQWGEFIGRNMMTPTNIMAREARKKTAATLIGGYLFMSLANKGFTGHWMHQNEEGRKLSIELPGTDSIGRRRFVTLGKQHKEAWEAAGITDRDKYPIPVVSRIATKLNVPLRFGIRLFENNNGWGPIILPEDSPWDVAWKGTGFVLSEAQPIIFGGPLQAAAGAIGERFLGVPAPTSPSEALVRFLGFPVGKAQPRFAASQGAIQQFLNARVSFNDSPVGRIP